MSVVRTSSSRVFVAAMLVLTLIGLAATPSSGLTPTVTHLTPLNVRIEAAQAAVQSELSTLMQGGYFKAFARWGAEEAETSPATSEEWVAFLESTVTPIAHTSTPDLDETITQWNEFITSDGYRTLVDSVVAYLEDPVVSTAIAGHAFQVLPRVAINAGLNPFQAIAHAVVGVTVLVGTGFAVAACAASVVCGIGAITLGLGAFVGNALFAAAAIQSQATQSRGSVDIGASSACTAAEECSGSWGARIVSNEPPLGRANQEVTYTFSSQTGGFSAIANGYSSPLSCSNLGGVTQCSQSFLALRIPNMQCKPMAALVVKIFWPTGGQAEDGRIFAKPVNGLC